MPREFAKIAFTDTVKAVQTRLGSREMYENFVNKGPANNTIAPKEAAFIAERESFYLGTVNSNHWPYIQFRGGPRGFLKVLDESTLGFADFVGNLQYLTVGNLLENDRVFLFLMDYAHRRRLKIWGRAQVIENDPDLIAQVSDRDYEAEVARAMIIKVAAVDWNCPQHIPIKYSEAEVEALLTPLQARIQDLEAQLAARQQNS